MAYYEHFLVCLYMLQQYYINVQYLTFFFIAFVGNTEIKLPI